MSCAAVNQLLDAPAPANIGDQLFLANACIKALSKKMSMAESEVEWLEKQLGFVGKQWLCDSEEYQGAVTKIEQQLYCKAVNELERLVVQQLFELGKLNMSGTGEWNCLINTYICLL